MVRTLSSERREQILTQAAEVFSREGYHQATVSHIVENAGVARGTFYLYFSSKREVFEVLLDQFLAALKSGIRVIDVSSPVPPLVQLKENLVRTMDTVEEYRTVATLMLGTIEAPDRQMESKVERFFAEVKSLLTGSIRRGQEIGLVRRVPAEVATHFVFGAAKEVFKEMVAVGPDRDSSASHRSRLAETLVDLVATGLLQKGVRAASPAPVNEEGVHC